MQLGQLEQLIHCINTRLTIELRLFKDYGDRYGYLVHAKENDNLEKRSLNFQRWNLSLTIYLIS